MDGVLNEQSLSEVYILEAYPYNAVKEIECIDVVVICDRQSAADKRERFEHIEVRRVEIRKIVQCETADLSAALVMCKVID